MTQPSQNIDPFKPVQPKIPGTDQPAPSAWKLPSHVGPFPTWMAAMFAAALVVGAITAWLTFRAGPADPTPVAQRQPAPSPQPVVAPATPVPEIADASSGPAEVATTDQLAQPWSFRVFRIRKRTRQDVIPAIVIRLPSGSGRSARNYWALVLEEPFGRCRLEFITDTARLEKEYDYAARYPMVVDPCNKSVYDPLRLGTLLDGALARGAVVAGPAIRPPRAVEVRIEGNRVIAVQTE